jgi:chromosomal replication initiation ATPase DnaA
MTPKARQLVFDLSHRSALGAEDFTLSPSNEQAVRVIDSWPQWPHPSMVLVGPEGSGKTHLANVWRQVSAAETIVAAELVDGTALTEARAIVIEDADRGIGSERALFHLMNLAREHGGTLLITGRTPPGDWTVTLPDLRSRLRACPVVQLGEPDESLLGLVRPLHRRRPGRGRRHRQTALGQTQRNHPRRRPPRPGRDRQGG